MAEYLNGYFRRKLDGNITSIVLKLVYDAKRLRKVNKDGDKQHLQNDLDRLMV